MVLFVETIAVSKFKATCLAVLERVRRTGQPVLITKRGRPLAEVVPPSAATGDRRTLGVMASRGRIAGDTVGPPVGPDEWDALA